MYLQYCTSEYVVHSVSLTCHVYFELKFSAQS